MSLPKHTTPSPLSSSPSKQSIRRISANHNHLPTSRPQSIIDRPPTAQQHHLENIPDPPPPPPAATIPPAPLTDQPTLPPTSTSAFQPFFTLIEDANTSEYHHPTVHYIFADDDTDIVTEATLRALESESDPTLAYNPNTRKGHNNNKTRSRRPQQQPQQEEGAQNTYEDEEKGPSLLPDSIPGVREHYVILDVDYASPGALGTEEMKEQSGNTTAATAGGEMLATSPLPPPQQEPHHGASGGGDAKSMVVTSAHSLSPAWQVLDAQLGPAPTFENNTNNTPSQGQGHSANGALMLKIRGTAGLPINNLLGKERDKERGCQRLEEMMDQFAKRLAELRLVIEAGGLGEHIEDAEVESSPGGKMDEHGVEQGQHENGQGLVEDATAGPEMGL
ncbi:uncharacterized protein BO95DRAFT_439314 [Aspergillus brunneoviolaceus CBS 621.78]|uniref:Uncharacterized protein n=1 Tax=Aspergillus brunneoviolaceus CBS 621.78 TaxID=1450534 RepID=A0ACD1GJY4_9EURO|nr:hypothetical protein BO95DRAFT_439314 [Aspergillus brunneoviolaceus CBS 621.78]RAH49396.1 hypothetical protein BO95DRAFT_439314 [Aspergillus brunneoviolaceus CBS 621.78]